MRDRWRDERDRRPEHERDDLRYAGETILGRADWGARESDYEHGFRPMHVRDDWHRAERRTAIPRDEARMSSGRDTSPDYRHAGETIGDSRDYAGRGPRGYQRNDQRVWEDVCDRLTADPRVDATDVEVRVEQGEVTLSGAVRSRDEKRRAEDAIDRIPGVRDVHNHLRVAHGEIGEPGAPKTPLNLASPGGESRNTVKNAATARSTAREHSPGTRGRRPR